MVSRRTAAPPPENAVAMIQSGCLNRATALRRGNARSGRNLRYGTNSFNEATALRRGKLEIPAGKTLAVVGAFNEATALSRRKPSWW